MSAEKPFRDNYYIIGEIGVDRKQLDRYCHYAMKIEKLLDDGNPVIPASWLKTLLSYYKNVGKLERQYYERKNKEQIDHHIKSVIDYFRSLKDYDFSGEYDYKASDDYLQFIAPEPIPPIGESKKEKFTRKKRSIGFRRSPSFYTLETLLHEVISSYMTYERQRSDSREEIKRDEAIRRFYHDVCAYANKYYSTEHKGKFSDYAKKVIAGYLTMKVAGLALSEKARKKPTKPNVYQGTRNAFKKVKE